MKTVSQMPASGPGETLVKPIELRASAVKTDNYPVDLSTVLRLIEEQNLEVAQDRKNTEIQQSRMRQSQVSILPNISATFSETKQRGQQRIISGSQGGFVSGGTVTPTSVSRSSGGGNSRPVQTAVQAQLSANWTVYPGGRTVYEILASKRRRVSANYQLLGTIQDQLSLAAQDYYKLLAAYQQKGVVVRSIIDAQEQVKLNLALVKVGKGIPLDLSRARTTYAQQQSALVETESALLQAEQSLLTRLNLDPTIHLVPNEMDADKKTLVPETVPVSQFIARAIDNNPGIKTADEELRALGYDYRATRSDLIPSFTLQTSVRGSGQELGDMQRSESAGITLNANLLQNMGLMIPLQMREKKQLIEQQELARQSLVRTVQGQVMIAFLNSENYESAIEAARQALGSAEESYQLSVGRFQAGYGINLDVLQAQTDLATARSNLVTAVLNYNQAQVQLVQAMGMASTQALKEGVQWTGLSVPTSSAGPTAPVVTTGSPASTSATTPVSLQSVPVQPVPDPSASKE